ncbi:flagellar basal body-associated FliL family protein [Marinobacter sp. M216]|uniref:Flagellar protein FliL n=1 Tax=Marinobacter albus TaxID=3030833 RepID=A0ABT7HAI4_9GAMM|nr:MULTISPECIES: flagellar basal body-associated FliL family protein [unclassified Marinobacter]MBW7470364.1 flagellar basal body-associated FliL family protein [Marinobacter sp. F4218]MDK9557371.1 flagellar basal body-associated FliL family protein [Marinobacter sp. M216]
MAENTTPDVAPTKKGRLKLIIMLVVVVILAIVLSVVGTLWFLGGSLPGMEADGGEGANEMAEESFEPSTYLELDKALVTTVQAEGRQRYAQVYLAMEATDPQALAAARLHLPLIRSQLVMALGNSEFDRLQTPEGRRGLADKMLTTVNEVLDQEGEPVIKRVLFRNFVVQ